MNRHVDHKPSESWSEYNLLTVKYHPELEYTTPAQKPPVVQYSCAGNRMLGAHKYLALKEVIK